MPMHLAHSSKDSCSRVAITEEIISDYFSLSMYLELLKHRFKLIIWQGFGKENNQGYRND